MCKHGSFILLCMALYLAASEICIAGGFHMVEHSGSGMGRACSGEAAVGDDASIIASNPAGMSLFNKSQFVGMVAYVRPAGEMFVERSSIEMKMKLFSIQQKTSVEVQGNQTGNAFSGGSVMPTLYYVNPVSKNFHFGFGAFSKFGLMQDYNDDFVGRFLLNQMQMVTFNLNASASYRVGTKWTIGAGVNVVMGQVTMDQFIPDMATLGGQTLLSMVDGVLPSAGATQSSSENLDGGRLLLKGGQTKFVPNLGVLYNASRRTRFGASYNPGYTLNMGGSISFRECSSTNANLLSGMTGVCGSGFDSEVAIELPTSMQLSAYHRFADSKLAVHGDVKYTQWSSSGQFQILRENSDTAQTEIFFDASHQYQDTFRYALGLTYNYSQKITLRTGAAFDQGFSKSGDYSLNGSDTDRYIFGLGGRYKVSDKLTVDLGYLHYFFQRYEVDQELSLASYDLGAVAVDASYQLRGNGLLGLDMLSLQMNWTY